MINEKMKELGVTRSVIRDLFEFGNELAKKIGRENVFDYSLGNPSVPAPDSVNNAITDLANNFNSVALHGYTSAQGAENVRDAIAKSINGKYNTSITANDIYITCGAAASLTICLNAIINQGDEVIVFAPFFPEYKVFVEKAGGKIVIIPVANDFGINFDELVKAINVNTKAVIINTPNNPSGAIITDEALTELCELLSAKSKEFNNDIFLISDEPYRELVYDRTTPLPYLTNLYDNTLVCYSFSKSLSLPGERIGYIVVNNKMKSFNDVYPSICGAGRALGYVCAPSMMQQVIIKCLNETSDINVYKKNRDLLYNALTEYGYDCVYPDGAFYLFVKSPEPNAKAFSERAKQYNLLLVPSDSFGCPGYVRLAYCVSTDMIVRSLPYLKKLIESYK